MKAAEIRNRFIQYFESKGHKKVPSSSLIPHNDPTLMFANAGMNQFKDYFTEKEKPPFKRAVTAQKCVRAGGKHNDLEEVGKTARHHTFFEMLGNFSFGDYFKKDAITFAWEFLTKEMGIDKNRLYITVHDSDDEAEELWHKEQGIPKDRIFRMGDKDNFWAMGPVGPCGPCSEIFYDHGEKYSTGNFDHPMKDEQRCVEIWNLVFMQFEQFEDGTRKPLPKPSVDTGMGLERISAVMQGVYWNYDTDLFTPIFAKLEQLSGKKYNDKKYSTNMRVVADHVRAASMLITDGAIPSNEGRGYVLRRIIRRGVRHANELGLTEASLYKLVPTVFEILGNEYVDNKANMALAEKTLKLEEEKFRDTLTTGLKVLNDYLNENKVKTFPGEMAFKLYDTYGFPLDLTQTILEEKDIKVDEAGFDKCMAEQVAQSRKHQKFQANDQDLDAFFKMKEKNGPTKFLGYETLSGVGTLIGMEKFGEGYALVFDQTPFYAESGGQVGDRGTINKNIKVLDVQKPIDDFHLHIVESINGLKVGEKYPLEVDADLRSRTIKNHSATHLLQAALIKVLGPHVKQAGSLVDEDKLRFDFTHDQRVSPKELHKVEEIVNSQIQSGSVVTAEITSKDAAIKKGAMALFGEKYGEKVRVIQMGGFSTELCGGTHVKDIAEISKFIIQSETSLAAGIRRITALTANEAQKYLQHQEELKVQRVKELLQKIALRDKEIEELSEQLAIKVQLNKSSDSNHSESELEEILKKKDKEISKLKDQLMSQESSDLFNSPEKIGSVDFYNVKTNCSPKDLRKLSDTFIDKNLSGLALITTANDDKIAFILRTQRDNKAINLSVITKNLFKSVDGSGGGKPDMSQGSFSVGDLDKFVDALKSQLN